MAWSKFNDMDDRCRTYRYCIINIGSRCHTNDVINFTTVNQNVITFICLFLSNNLFNLCISTSADDSPVTIIWRLLLCVHYFKPLCPLHCDELPNNVTVK